METVYLYLDVLFFFNFAVNLLLLYFVSYTCSCKLSWGRGILASAVGSIYLCALCAWNYSVLEHFCFKILVSAFMIFTAFRIRRFRDFAKLFLVYYLMSFLLAGGIRFSANFFFGALFQIPLWAVGAGILLLLLLGPLYFYTLREKNIHMEKTFHLTYNGKTLEFRGFSDTGNTLTEPIEHLGVIVVKAETLKDIADFSHPESIRNIRLIPCRTVTNEEGILYGFKPDSLHCEEKSLHAVVAASDTLEDFDAIFNPVILMS